MTDRFVLIENNPAFPANEKTCWYWDTERRLTLKDDHPFVAKQCYTDRNPNDFIRHSEMALLFNDQAEYYAVCLDCKAIYGGMQWAGSTRAPNWQKDSAEYLEEHIEKKGWCEFCDPIFGNGGWTLR